jgi:hypothetical protein
VAQNHPTEAAYRPHQPKEMTMGYAYYTLADGREAGYGVDALCDHPDCGAEIDRGLAYLCGQRPGGYPHGCGDYFCSGHLYLGYFDGDTVEQRLERKRHHVTPHQMCEACLNQWVEAGYPDEWAADR